MSLCTAVVSLTGDEGLAGLVLRKALQKLAHLLSECGTTATEEIDVLVKESCSVVEVCDHHCVEQQSLLPCVVESTRREF